MSMHKPHRSKLAEYQILREQAQNEAARRTLNLQLESLTQKGLDTVIKRAFSTPNRKEKQTK